MSEPRIPNGARQRLNALSREFLAHIPPEFSDDGCSSSPDGWFGFSFRWACKIHDHFWCTRCHPEGTMTKAWKRLGDATLRRCIRASLPWHWRWLSGIYWAAVRVFKGSYDTCGIEPEGVCDSYRLDGRCRHGMAEPEWMLFNEALDAQGATEVGDVSDSV